MIAGACSSRTLKESSRTPEPCEAGTAIACRDGCEGFKSCNTDGQGYGPCECDGGVGGTTIGGTAGASNGGGTEPGGGGGGESGGGEGGGSGAIGGEVGEVIDDFEDGDIQLTLANGRNGRWSLFHDETNGVQGPDPFLPELLPASDLTFRPGSTHVLHMTATGFSAWGTGLAANFMYSPAASAAAYDASRYKGVRFWAKVGAGADNRVRFMIPDTTTDPAGGKCNPSGDPSEDCADHFGVVLLLTTSWQEYRVEFSELRQIGWGLSAPELVVSEVYGISFSIEPNATVDIWLDDFYFIVE